MGARTAPQSGGVSLHRAFLPGFALRSPGREREGRPRDETAHSGTFRSPAEKRDRRGREQGPRHARPAPMRSGTL